MPKSTKNESGVKYLPNWSFLIALAVITFFSFSPALEGTFLNIDDERFISKNELITEGSLTNLSPVFQKQLFSPHYKPLVYLSWILEKELFGIDPYYFHLNNILLHITNTLILFFVLWLLLPYFKVPDSFTGLLAFLFSLAFAVHPMKVESVAWAVERKDVLFALFYLLGMWCYLRYLNSDRKKIWMALTAVAYLLSLLSKSMGITLIAVLFLIDYAAGRKLRLTLLTEKAVLLIVAAVGVIVFGLVIKFEVVTIGVTEGFLSAEQTVIEPSNYSGLPAWYKQLLSMNYRLLFFALHFMVPLKLAIVYPRAFLLDLVGGAIHALPIVNAAILVALFLIRKKAPWLVFGVALYLISILPAIVMGDKGTNFLSDRYMYIPSIGIVIAVGLALTLTLKRFTINRVAYLGLFGGLALIMAVSTYNYSKAWIDNERLYTDAIEKYPGMLELAYQNRAKDRRERKLYEQALADYEVLMGMEVEDAAMFGSMANIYGEQNNIDKALEFYSRSIEADPTYATSYLNRGVTYARSNRLDLALQDFRKAHELDTTEQRLYEMWAFASQQTGDLSEAIEWYTYAIEAFEPYPRLYFSRGLCWFNSNNFPKAAEDFTTVTQLQPSNGEAFNNLSASYFNMGRFGMALEYALKARELGFEVDEAYFRRIQDNLRQALEEN